MATTQQSYGPAAKKMKLDHEGTNGSVPSPVGTPVQTQPTTSTATTPVSTPATTQPAYTTTAQWSTQIPIDPALQQQPTTTPQHPMMPYQHYTYGATHYPAAAYSHTHFQQYQTAQPALAAPTPAPTTAPIPTATPAPAPSSTPTPAPPTLSRHPTQAAQTTTTATQPAQPETTNVATLNDALGSAGVDLRAEEENLQRSQDHHTTYRSSEDRSRKQPNAPSFDSRILGTTMRDIGSQHKVTSIPEDSVNYVALALRSRLQDLVTGMIAAAEHRVRAQFDKPPALYEDGTPMWSVVVRRDTKRQLEALEKMEREEEQRQRKERKIREEAEAQAAAAVLSQGTEMAAPDGAAVGGDDGMAVDSGTPVPKKQKKKKDGPGVTAKNMSEDVQKRLSNAVASQAAGLGRRQYAWMSAGGGVAAAAAAAKKEKSTPPATGTPGGTTTTGAATQAGSTTQPTNGSSWSKPYFSTLKNSASPAPQDEEKTVVTMRDAMFVIGRERGHGAGRGAASRAWV